MIFQRTELLIGKEGVENLSRKKVAIIGIGGVGGYTAITLARAGISNFVLVDFDVVDITNINRQIIANENTIGKNKVDVCKSMILSINSKCNVEVFAEKLDGENVEKILKDVDMCVDAIDIVTNKIQLIEFCKNNNIEIISAMGAGNRYDIPNFHITDVFNTSGDGLAKVLRKELKKRGINSLKVAISNSPACKVSDRTIGSISYYPAVCGCVISAYVVNYFLDKLKGEKYE